MILAGLKFFLECDTYLGVCKIDSLGRLELRVGVEGRALSFWSSTTFDLLASSGLECDPRDNKSRLSLSELSFLLMCGAETGLLHSFRDLELRPINMSRTQSKMS